MNIKDNKIKRVENYIFTFPKHIQDILQKLRKLIKESAPDAKEAMSYGVPAFQLNGNLVLYAAFKNHIGLYPTPSAIKKFKKELAGYETSEGTIKFSLDNPIPFDLIKKIIKYRVKENLQRN